MGVGLFMIVGIKDIVTMKKKEKGISRNNTSANSTPILKKGKSIKNKAPKQPKKASAW